MSAWLLWVLVSIGLSVLTLNRAWLAVLVALFLRVGVPSVASHHLTGALIPLHPASTFLVVRAFAAPLLGAVESIRLMARGVAWHVTIAATGILMVETKLQQSTLAPLDVVNDWVAPLCGVLLLFEAAASVTGGGLRRVVSAYYLLAAGEAGLAIVQLFTHSSLVYTADRASLWWDPATFSRASGTLDSPLDLSMFLTTALPLLRRERRPAIVLTVGGLIVAGVMASESRIGILLAVPVFLFIGWGSARSTLGRVALVSGVSLAVVGLAIGALTTGLLSRFTNADGANSNAARSGTRQIFYDAVGSHWVVGGGSGYSFQVTAAFGSRTSLEDGIYMTALDLGGIMCLLVVLAQLALVVRSLTGGHAFIAIAASIALVYEFSYSGFATPSANSLLSWLVFGFASVVTVVPSALTPTTSPEAPPEQGPAPGGWDQAPDGWSWPPDGVVPPHGSRAVRSLTR